MDGNKANAHNDTQCNDFQLLFAIFLFPFLYGT